MGQTFYKASKTIRSIFKPLTLFVFVIFYLIIGHVVEYIYGPKVSNSLVLSGPFYLFVLAVVSLSLLSNLLRKIFQRKLTYSGFFIHAGLIGLFSTSLVTNIDGHYKSTSAKLEIQQGQQSNKAILDTFEVSILNRNTNEKIFVDLNYSLRPQGLNLDFGPTYLLSYLPFSQKTYNLRDASGEVSAVIEVLNKKTNKAQKVLLSTNNYDYQNFYLTNGLEIFLYDQQKLNCLLDLSNVNPSCIGLLQRRSVNDLRNELCKKGNFLITKSGFISLADSCRLNEVRERLVVDNTIISLTKYYTDKQLEEDYHYKRDMSLVDTDVVKYYEKQSPKKVRFIRPGQSHEIIDVAGDFHDLSFNHKVYELPFSVKLMEVREKEVTFKIRDIDHTLKRGSIISIDDYNIRLSKSDTYGSKAILTLLKDPLRPLKTLFFLVFCTGLISFSFVLTKERMES